MALRVDFGPSSRRRSAQPSSKSVDFSDTLAEVILSPPSAIDNKDHVVEEEVRVVRKPVLKRNISESESEKIRHKLRLAQQRLNAFHHGQNEASFDEVSVSSKSCSENSFSSTSDFSSEDKEKKKSSVKSWWSGRHLSLPFIGKKKQGKSLRSNSVSVENKKKKVWTAKSVSWYTETSINRMDKVSLECVEDKIGTYLVLQSMADLKPSKQHGVSKHQVVLQDVTQFGLGPLCQFKWFPDHPALKKPWNCIYLVYVDTSATDALNWEAKCNGKKETAAFADNIKTVAMEIQFQDVKDLLTVFWGLYEMVPRCPKTTVSESSQIEFMKKFQASG